MKSIGRMLSAICLSLVWSTVDGGFLSKPADEEVAVADAAGDQGPSSVILSMGTMTPGDKMLRAQDNKSTLEFDVRGDLVLKDTNGSLLWMVEGDGSEAQEVVVETSGDVVLYGGDGDERWATNTIGNVGAYLKLQDNCELVVLSVSTGKPLWSSGTSGCKANVSEAQSTFDSDEDASVMGIYGSEGIIFEAEEFLNANGTSSTFNASNITDVDPSFEFGIWGYHHHFHHRHHWPYHRRHHWHHHHWVHPWASMQNTSDILNTDASNITDTEPKSEFGTMTHHCHHHYYHPWASMQNTSDVLKTTDAPNTTDVDPNSEFGTMTHHCHHHYYHWHHRHWVHPWASMQNTSDVLNTTDVDPNSEFGTMTHHCHHHYYHWHHHPWVYSTMSKISGRD